MMIALRDPRQTAIPVMSMRTQRWIMLTVGLLFALGTIGIGAAFLLRPTRAPMKPLPQEMTNNADNPKVDPKLHGDERVKALAPYDIDSMSKAARWITDVPYLDVVPAGRTKPREEVFRALDLDDELVQDMRVVIAFGSRGAFIAWHVSPTYDLVCMTGTPDSRLGDHKLEAMQFADPRREVYGVRIVCNADADRLFLDVGDEKIRVRLNPNKVNRDQQ